MNRRLWKSHVKKSFGFMIAFCVLAFLVSAYFLLFSFGFVSGIVFNGTMILLGLSIIGFSRESALGYRVNVDLDHRGYKTLMKNISTINVNDEYVNFFGFFVDGQHYSSLTCDDYKVLCVPNGENLDYYVYTFEHRPFSYLAVVDKRLKPYNGGVQVFLKTLN